MKDKILEILNDELSVQYGSTRECANQIENIMFNFILWKEDNVGKRNQNDLYLYWEDHYNLLTLFEYWIKHVFQPE